METKPMSSGSSRSSGPTRGFDRRTEQRMPVDEQGVLSLTAPEPMTIKCQLLDVSKHGFRAVHAHAELAPGAQVKLRSSTTGEVLARVIWTAIVSEHIESGFYILGS